MMKKTLFTALCAAGLAVGANGLWVDSLEAADHAEAPIAGADPAADIADFYAWHTVNGTVVSVITFAPFGATTAAGVYDDEVLYSIEVDLGTQDQVSDATMHFRFGQNTAGDWGIEATMVNPLGNITFSGPVETVITEEIAPSQNVTLWAGAADDPFFFNQTGFNNTLSTATLAFDGSDQVAGLNVTAIVVETPAPIDFTTFQPVTNFDTWATTSRL